MVGFAKKLASELNVIEIVREYGVSLAAANCLVNIHDCNSDSNSGPDWKSYEDAKLFFQGLNLGSVEYEQIIRCITNRLEI